MGAFENNIIKVKSAYNIVDLIEMENVSLKSTGADEYTGLCPFHSEKTPSFKVNETFQNYRCFGCGASGDIISFIENTHGTSFYDSLVYLADNKGIELEVGDGEDERPRVNTSGLLKIVSDAYNFYKAEFDKLDDSHPAKQEIIKRGFSIDNDTYGYAPEKYGALYEHLLRLGHKKELMLESELIMEKDGKYFDFFYGRLLFTIRDFTGRPITFSSRKLFESDNRGKYVNGKNSPIFNKATALYNIDRAKKEARLSKKIYLVEGQFDVEAFRASGIDNVVASSGTAFTEGHLKAARQLVGEDGELIFSFDGDEAGVNAALKIFTNYPTSHDISKVVIAPSGADPADVYLKFGSAGMDELINSAVPITDFVVSEVAKLSKITDITSRYNYIKTLSSEYLSVMNDKILLDYMIRRASVISGLDTDKIKDVLGDVKKPNRKKTESTAHKNEEIEELKVMVPINEDDDSDKCFISAMSLLIWRSDILLNESKGRFIPSKFNDFLAQFIKKVRMSEREDRDFYFIVEEYEDTDFAKLLMNIDNSMLKDLTDEELIEHYIDLMDRGEAFYKSAEYEKKKSELIGALNQATSNEEILSMIKLLKEGE